MISYIKKQIYLKTKGFNQRTFIYLKVLQTSQLTVKLAMGRALMN